MYLEVTLSLHCTPVGTHSYTGCCHSAIHVCHSRARLHMYVCGRKVAKRVTMCTVCNEVLNIHLYYTSANAVIEIQIFDVCKEKPFELN